VLEDLKGDYEDQNVLFIEQDVDAPEGNRLDRWFDGYGNPGTVYLPLVMVDSGYRVSNGQQSFRSVYSRMVDNSLRRPAEAVLVVESERVGSTLRFDVRLTNSTGIDLSAANDVTLNALVFEEPTDPSSVPVVMAADTASIMTLADGATVDRTFDVSVGSADWNRLRWVVIADYLPIGEGNPYDTLQAVMGP